MARDVCGRGWLPVCGGCSHVCWDLLEHGKCFWGLGSKEKGPPVMNPDTLASPGAVRAKVLVVREAEGDGFRCGESASRFRASLVWDGA